METTKSKTMLIAMAAIMAIFMAVCVFGVDTAYAKNMRTYTVLNGDVLTDIPIDADTSSDKDHRDNGHTDISVKTYDHSKTLKLKAWNWTLEDGFGYYKNEDVIAYMKSKAKKYVATPGIDSCYINALTVKSDRCEGSHFENLEEIDLTGVSFRYNAYMDGDNVIVDEYLSDKVYLKKLITDENFYSSDCVSAQFHFPKGTTWEDEEGNIWNGGEHVPEGAHTYTRISGGKTVDAVNVMYRLYNPNSGEHFYTASSDEMRGVVTAGWNYEGIGWNAPTSGDPVYRLYNPNGGDHHYTLSAEERDKLKKVGWKYEGIGWYSDTSKSVPLYRQYNPNAKSGSHNFTTSKKENDNLKKIGWRAEGIGWYGVNA